MLLADMKACLLSQLVFRPHCYPASPLSQCFFDVQLVAISCSRRVGFHALACRWEDCSRIRLLELGIIRKPAIWLQRSSTLRMNLPRKAIVLCRFL